MFLFVNSADSTFHVKSVDKGYGFLGEAMVARL